MFSRGGTGKSASTSSLLRHLKNSHVSEYKTPFSNINEGNQPGTSKSVFSATSAVASSSGNINNMMQPTVQQFVSSKRTWDINDPRASRIHYKLAEMICLDNQPYSIVENTGFCHLLQTVLSITFPPAIIFETI